MGTTSCFILVNKLEDCTFQAGNIKNLFPERVQRPLQYYNKGLYLDLFFYKTLIYFTNFFLSNFLGMTHVYKLHIVSNALFIYNFLMTLFIHDDEQYM